ncbi:MAG: hypothetical protein Tsb0016_06070 [Sphingomonadales bacterium]
MNMMLRRLVAAMALAGLAMLAGLGDLGAQAQEGDETVAAGRGPWQAHVQPGFVKPRRVALDTDCGDETSAELRPALTAMLQDMGIAVDDDARQVLRYSVSPCTVLNRDNDALLRDAYDGTSRHDEFTSVRPQFKLDFGGKGADEDRRALSLMLYVPGQSPVWRAEATVGRSGATRLVQFKAMAQTMLEAIGEARAATMFTP